MNVQNNHLKLKNKRMTKIKFSQNVTNLVRLDLSFNKISKIENLETFTNLAELYLYDNEITEIKGLDNLVVLQDLSLHNNQITEIKGLDNLINLHHLTICCNEITEIKGLDHLVVLQDLSLRNNQITEIKGLDNLINLKLLNLKENQIIEIKELDNLSNLQELVLCYNQITEIKNLDNLVNLKQLFLDNNQITEIKGLDTLINLQELYLSHNQITEIKNIDNLVNLKQLYLNNNQITELPLSLCNLRNLRHFNYSGNPIEYIPLPVQRWLDRINRRVTDNNMVYNDGQNIHNHHIQNSFRCSLENILRDKNLLNIETVKSEILNNDVLTELTKREILNYCDDQSEHATYLITYTDLLTYVWSRISKSENKHELCKVLNQEISDGLCMCFTGRLTRLLNCLTGFYDDIELQISDSEQITNIIVALKKKYDGDELVDKVKAELIDRKYTDSIINEWLEYL